MWTISPSSSSNKILTKRTFPVSTSYEAYALRLVSELPSDWGLAADYPLPRPREGCCQPFYLISGYHPLTCFCSRSSDIPRQRGIRNFQQLGEFYTRHYWLAARIHAVKYWYWINYSWSLLRSLLSANLTLLTPFVWCRDYITTVQLRGHLFHLRGSHPPTRAVLLLPIIF